MLWNVLSRRMPALLMTMSTVPKASSAVWTMASPPSGVATLLVSATASPPRSLISWAVLWAGPSVVALAAHRAAEVVDDDAGATAGQLEGVLAAEAAARAGDDRDLAVVADVCHSCLTSCAVGVWVGERSEVSDGSGGRSESGCDRGPRA